MKRHQGAFLTLPPTLWLLLFYALPTVIVLLLMFHPADPYGGIGSSWSWEALRALKNPVYPAIVFRTLWLSGAATAVCVLAAIPVAYHLARLVPWRRNALLLLIIVPFWTNFLIRIYAWKVFLNPDGFFCRLLGTLGLLPAGTVLLYNQWSVLVVMIYTYLPYAVLPVYAAAEKFDFALLDAAEDLGARPFYAFRKIFLPSIFSGVRTAVVVVLIPALGAYLIPDLVGDAACTMLGDKIAQCVFTERNLPLASALSALLMIGTFVPLLLYFHLYRRGTESGEARS